MDTFGVIENGTRLSCTRNLPCSRSRVNSMKSVEKHDEAPGHQAQESRLLEATHAHIDPTIILQA